MQFIKKFDNFQTRLTRDLIIDLLFFLKDDYNLIYGVCELLPNNAYYVRVEDININLDTIELINNKLLKLGLIYINSILNGKKGIWIVFTEELSNEINYSKDYDISKDFETLRAENSAIPQVRAKIPQELLQNFRREHLNLESCYYGKFPNGIDFLEHVNSDVYHLFNRDQNTNIKYILFLKRINNQTKCSISVSIVESGLPIDLLNMGVISNNNKHALFFYLAYINLPVNKMQTIFSNLYNTFSTKLSNRKEFYINESVSIKREITKDDIEDMFIDLSNEIRLKELISGVAYDAIVIHNKEIDIEKEIEKKSKVLGLNYNIEMIQSKNYIQSNISLYTNEYLSYCNNNLTINDVFDIQNDFSDSFGKEVRNINHTKFGWIKCYYVDNQLHEVSSSDIKIYYRKDNNINIVVFGSTDITINSSYGNFYQLHTFTTKSPKMNIPSDFNFIQKYGISEVYVNCILFAIQNLKFFGAIY